MMSRWLIDYPDYSYVNFLVTSEMLNAPSDARPYPWCAYNPPYLSRMGKVARPHNPFDLSSILGMSEYDSTVPIHLSS